MRFNAKWAVASSTAWLLLGFGAGAPELAAQESGATVSSAVVATDVQEREPVGEALRFSADVGTLYFYTIFEGDFPEQRFEHVWLRNGEEVGRVPLTAAGPRWRTWSTKQLPADWTGEWSARVVDAAGNQLASVDFQIGG